MLRLILTSSEEIAQYDVIYVTGGVTQHLVEHMEKLNFKDALDHFFENNGIYIGVSAGSIALSRHQSEHLGYVKSKIEVHSEVGSVCGVFVDAPCNTVKLTDLQAILVRGDTYEVIE